MISPEPTPAEAAEVVARLAAWVPETDPPLPDAPVLISSFFTPTPTPIPVLRMVPDDMPDDEL